MRHWRAGIGAVLAVGLLLGDAGSPRAGDGPVRAEALVAEVPRPGLKPLLLEPLVWDEACTPAHTRVEIPVGAMSATMREAWGMPQTADPAAWSPGGVYLLAYAYETGEMGMPDVAEAARIYCLLLRHDGDLGAIALSRLHARGAGVAFSPALADHFARVALGWYGTAAFEGKAQTAFARDGLAPADPALVARLHEAEAWRQRVDALPPVEKFAAIRRFTERGEGPRSDRLLDGMYTMLAYDALTAGEMDIVMAYLDYALARHATGTAVGRELVEELWFALLLHRAAVDHQHAPAQALAGRSYLSGTGHKVAPAAAFLYLRAAREQGHPVAIDLETVLRRVPHDLKPGLCKYIAYALLPNPIRTSEQLERFHSHLREPVLPDIRCTLP